MNTQGVQDKQEFQLSENSSPYRQRQEMGREQGGILKRNTGSKVFLFDMPKILGLLGKGIRFINYVESRTQIWIYSTFNY